MNILKNTIILMLCLSLINTPFAKNKNFHDFTLLYNDYPWGTFESNFKSKFTNYNLDTATIGALSEGLSADSLFKLSFGKNHFVIRFLDEHKGIATRKSIATAYLWASYNKLGPKVYLYDSVTYKVLMLKFIQGRTLSLSDTSNPEIIRSLAQILRKTHKTPVPKNDIPEFSQFTYGAKWFKTHQNKTIGPSVLSEAYNRWKKLYNLTSSKNNKIVMLHNDPNLKNILWDSSKIILLDWELAGLGDPKKEIAHVLAWYGLDKKLATEFLKIYFERQPTLSEKQLLDNLKTQILLEFAWIGLSTLTKKLTQKEWDNLYKKAPSTNIKNLSIIQLHYKTKPPEEETRKIFLGLIKNFMSKTESQMHLKKCNS